MKFKEFESFLDLTDTKIYFSQIIYFNYNLTIKDYFKQLNKSDIKYIFQDSFIWNKSEQGEEFWSEIDDAFQIVIKQKLKENFGK